MTGFIAKRGSLIGATLLALLVLVATARANAEEEAEDEREKEVGYYALKPSIVSNLTGGPKYIRCDVQLKTEYASELEQIKLHSPALRHSILMLIAGEDGRKLMTRDGKEQLRKAALESVQTQLEELAGDPLIADLYFTAYYVK